MRILGEQLTKKDVALALGAASISAIATICFAAYGWTDTHRGSAGAFALLSMPPAVVFSLSLVIAMHARRIEARFDELEGELSQTEPLIALSKLIDAKRALPPMREYAIAPDFALILYELVRDLEPKLIVETGSGVSTLVCAYALEKNGGDGKVVALDHNATYAEKTRRSLARHGLSHRATVVHAPLEDTKVGGGTYKWYARAALDAIGGSIDMVVDDGPPKYVGAMARYASLHLLSPKMTADAPFVVDYIGDEEREILARWESELPYDAERLATKKGNVILRRRAARGEP